MGEVIVRREPILAGPAQALAGLLDVPLPDLDTESLPPCWHWFYLLDRPAAADCGRDGHPVRGVVPVPPGPGYRRMWAGGRVEQRGGLRVGLDAMRHSEVTATTQKEGRSGRLTFLQVTHTISQLEEPVVVERQDIVYREEAPADQTAPAAETSEPPAPEPVDAMHIPDGAWDIEVTPTLLFRFSALTYNGHRIHYDRDYARHVEGYPGLVTHGPLQALAMAEAARAHYTAGEFTRAGVLEYRLVAPLFDHQGLRAHADPAGRGPDVDTRITDRTGRVTAQGRATLARP